MALIIVGILLVSYLLMATESMTNVNKSAIAMFACTVGWVLYICYGTDFVMSQHAAEFTAFLDGSEPNSENVKDFIASNIFLKYVGRASEVVLFLLGTMAIVEILDNNGCFDFISQLLRTRRSQKMLWVLSLITFVISANLDNLTTTVMMLFIMRKIVPSRRLRMLYGSAIVVAANMGGALTVIGDPVGLVMWNTGKVTPTSFSMSLLAPCLLVWLGTTWWIGRSLPEQVETEWITMPYRGDDTRLNVWERLLMLFVGIGGLWFIPTFHNITHLSPFLGALCVLSVLWIVNEAVNRKLMSSDTVYERRMPRGLLYGSYQYILFIIGMMLALGVVQETGAISWLWAHLPAVAHQDWALGPVAGVVSAVLDNFATVSSFMVLHPMTEVNDGYWRIIAFATAAGGNVLPIGSIAGLVFMKAEHTHVGWYFRNVGWKALVTGLLGYAILVISL